MAYLLSYPRNMTNISKKMFDHGKKQKVFLQIGLQQLHVRNSVIGWDMPVPAYIWYVTITKMTKNESSGIQASVCGNLVYEQYMIKKPYKIIYYPFFAVTIYVKHATWPIVKR